MNESEPQRIAIADIKPNPYQRDVRPWKVRHIADKMRARGYNESYPVTLDADSMLIDGGHRVAAAAMAGITQVPYLILTGDIPVIQHAINCNTDGADTSEYDVFDFASLCWQMAHDGQTGAQIAEMLGWGSDAKVTYYSNIKRLLHPLAWDLARNGLTRVESIVNDDDDDIVSQELTIVNLKESHFRALLQWVPWEGDAASMRAQVAAVRDILERAGQKDKRFGNTTKTVTARWIGDLAQRYAWHLRLARAMRDGLVARVPMRDRINLLKAIRANVYGDSEDAKNLDKFLATIGKLNEQALGVTLYQDDALCRLPQIEDGSIALVVTDPPYNVTDHEWDKIGTDDEYLDFTRGWLEALRPKLADDYHLFLFCDPDYQARIESLLVSDGWPLCSRVVWSNRSLPSGRNAEAQFVRTWQMVFHCGTHPLNWPPLWSDNRFDVQVWSAPNANMKDGGWHPTPKPEAFIEFLVRLGSKPTDTVLDPFAGGGTTGAGCGLVGQRRCILIERDDTFCGNIERRLQIRRVSE